MKALKTCLRPERVAAVVIILVCVLCAALNATDKLSTDGWVVIGAIGLMFIAMLYDMMPAHFSMILALAVVMFAQIVTTKEALEGFSSSAVLSVAVLYVVAAGLTATGGLNYFMNKILGTPSSLAGAQLRLMIPVTMISAFLNNTPVVALMIPIIQQWAQKINVAPSQLFMPLSFAAILGGTCTLIGTSTNLVVAGKAEDDLDYKVGLFDLGLVGVPVLLTGVAYVVLFAPYLLPNEDTLKLRRNQKNQGEKEEFTTYIRPDILSESVLLSCFVKSSSSSANRTVVEANLRGLKGLYLSSVQRGEYVLQAIGPEFVINAGDILFFTGVVDNFSEFCEERGFTPMTAENVDRLLEKKGGSQVTSPRNSRPRASTFDGHVIRTRVKAGFLAGKTPKDVNFRKLYKAAILSVHRGGRKLATVGNLGKVPLQEGDELFLLTNETFSWEDERTSADLALIRNAAECAKSGESEIEREFLFSMKVSGSAKLIGTSPLAGKTIESAGLRGLPGLFLIALERQGHIKRAVGSDEVLLKNDILWFIGERNAFAVLRQIPGLVPPDNQVKKLNFEPVERRLVECVISMNSDMVGKTIKEARFRTRFRAVVIAVHREGHRVLMKIGDIELKAGDVLLLDTGPYFLQRFRDDRNFLLVAEIENSGVPQFKMFYLALCCMVVMMTVYTVVSNFDDISLSLFECAVVASGVMIYFNIITGSQAMQSVNWDVIIAIACAFGLSNALENSGVADAIGNALVDLANNTGTGETGVLGSVYLATFLVSIVVANNAAALLMFPIAVRALESEDEGGDDTPVNEKSLQKVLFILMLAASSSFSSPFGYQTNLMVYGPGNYMFIDYLKFGLPMQFWQMAFSVLFVAAIDVWYLMWIGSFALFLVVVLLKSYVFNKSTLSGNNSESTAATFQTEENQEMNKFDLEDPEESEIQVKLE